MKHDEFISSVIVSCCLSVFTSYFYELFMGQSRKWDRNPEISHICKIYKILM